MATPNLAAVASMTPGILCSTQMSTTADTPVYTVPANRSAIVKHGVISNTSAAVVNVTIRVVPSGGSADGSHSIISNYPLAAGDSLPLTEYLAGASLGDGDAIHVQASVAAVLDVVITGVVNS